MQKYKNILFILSKENFLNFAKKFSTYKIYWEQSYPLRMHTLFYKKAFENCDSLWKKSGCDGDFS